MTLGIPAEIDNPTPPPATPEPAADPPAAASTPANTTPPAEAPPTPEQLAAAEAEKAKAAEAEKQAAKEAKRAELKKLAAEKTERFRSSEQQRAEQARQRKVASDAQAEIEKLRQKASEADALAAIKDNAELLRFLRSKGVTAEQVAQALFEENTPEYQKKMAAKRDEDLRAEVDRQVKEQLEAFNQQRAQEAAEANWRNSVRQFATDVTSAKTDDGSPAYPALSYMIEFHPAQVQTRLEEIIAKANQRGIQVDDNDFADFLENEFGPRYNKVRERFSPTSLQANGTSKTPGTSSTVATGSNATRAPAVTNSVVAAANPLPANFEDLPDDEQNKILAQRYWADQKARGR